MDYTFSEQSRLVRAIFKKAYGLELTDLQLHYIDTVYYAERQVKIYDIDIFRTWGTMFCYFAIFIVALVTIASLWITIPSGLLFAYDVYHLYRAKRMKKILIRENEQHLAVYGVK